MTSLHRSSPQALELGGRDAAAIAGELSGHVLEAKSRRTARAPIIANIGGLLSRNFIDHHDRGSQYR